ncbi:RNA polymerase sigma factor [Planctomycetota bacterium]
MDTNLQENLVADICKVDKSAYTMLVKASASRVFAICFATVGNRADAEDIAQQAFLKGYSEIGHLRDSQQFEPWIARIAKNLCIDFLRRENRKTNGLYEVADGSNSPKEYPELTAALEKLPQQYRVILLLYYFDGQSTESIAQTLGTSRRAVHTRISRARKQLRQILEAMGDV